MATHVSVAKESADVVLSDKHTSCHAQDRAFGLVHLRARLDNKELCIALRQDHGPQGVADATGGSGMKQALAHARTHCALTDGQVRVMPSRLTSSRTLRLRGHHAAYWTCSAPPTAPTHKAQSCKGAGRINTPGLKPDGQISLSQNFF